MQDGCGNRLRQQLAPAAACACLIGLLGCGSNDGGPELAPVRGIVLYQDKPVPSAMVEFVQPGSPFRSMGLTNEEGKFELKSVVEGDGAPVGKNKVVVAIREVRLDPRITGGVDYAAIEQIEDVDERRRRTVAMMGTAKPPPRYPKPVKGLVLPARYASADTTNLELEVVSRQDNEFQIVLGD